MSLRDTLNENQNLVVVVAVVVIAVAFGYIFFLRGGGGDGTFSGLAYYKDLETGTVFTADASLNPPIESPDGNQAARVHFFTCTGDCGEEDRVLGWYEKYTPEAKKVLDEWSPNEDEGTDEMAAMTASEEGLRVSVDGENWMRPMMPQYERAKDEKLSCPDGGTATYCRPEK